MLTSSSFFLLPVANVMVGADEDMPAHVVQLSIDLVLQACYIFIPVDDRIARNTVLWLQGECL